MSLREPKSSSSTAPLDSEISGRAETLTLVLTDVVDSTKLAAELGDERNAEVWDGHDRVARELVAKWRGREVERTDGILVLFDDDARAVAFARDYLSALSRLDPPLSARIGVHRGPIVVRANPGEHVRRGAKATEADGLALSVTARVCALARGGQVLLTRAALGERLQGTSQGFWNLKGAPDPLELFALPDQRSVAPLVDGDKALRVVKQGEHWVPVRQIPKTLPAEWDAFFGRARELETIAKHLAGDVRLLTLVGAGGSGKTRLACRYAWTSLAEYPGGIWFCDLTEARDAGDVVRAVAGALGMSLDAVDPVDQIGLAVAGRGRCLVVLDNFEQVVSEAVDTMGRWLAAAPGARFLVTSRERLDVVGEVALMLDTLDEDDAVRLFTARAAAALPGYDVPEEEEADVRALVQRLDRLPLAIELAAPRVLVLSTRAQLERLSTRLDALTVAGRRTSRQATLRASLDWSWELLDPVARVGLAELSVFEGGFTLAAADAVLSADLADDVVQSLVDRSLVRRVDGERFDLLVSVKAYAGEKLDELARRVDVEGRHGRYFAGLGGSDLDGLLARARELDNLVAACRRAVRRADPEVALPALKAVWAVTDRQGPASLAADLASEVGDLPGLAPGLRDRLQAEALLARGSYLAGQRELRLCLRRLGFPEPRTLLGVIIRVVSRGLRQVWRRRFGARRPPDEEHEGRLAATRAYQRLVETYWFSCAPPWMFGAALSALDICEPLGPSPELARAYATVALATSGLRFDQAADRYAVLARTTAEGSRAIQSEAYVRFLACVYRIGLARFEEVRRDLLVATDLFEKAEEHRLIGDAHTVQGTLDLYEGRFRSAQQRFVEVTVAGERRGNDQHRVWGLLGAAEALLRLGQPEPALGQVREALEVLKRFPSPAEIARATGFLARLELEVGRLDGAGEAADRAARLLKALGPPTAHYLLEGYASVVEVRLAQGRSAKADLRRMRGFAKTFPIGEPRLAWLEAEGLRRRGRLEAARRRATSGRARAEALGMPYEVARLDELIERCSAPAGPLPQRAS